MTRHMCCYHRPQRVVGYSHFAGYGTLQISQFVQYKTFVEVKVEVKVEAKAKLPPDKNSRGLPPPPEFLTGGSLALALTLTSKCVAPYKL